MRIAYQEMKEEFKRVLMKKGFAEQDAAEAAESFTNNSCDGVYSHGVNRFPRVIEYIEKGYIKPDAVPEKISSFGAIERWDGNLALGNLTAKKCMDRAIELAGEYGIGCVALKNTNHWMRGGEFGWQAAEKGFIGICWTNTQPNMPAWGAQDRRIGNNPIILALPRAEGPVVVDMAMSQFSYGKIEKYKMDGQELPVPGGFDSQGNLTTNPKAIEETWRVLPVGYWKGSGLSIVLDMIASMLSGGNTTHGVGKLGDDEYALSQVFISIAPDKLGNGSGEEMINDSIKYIKESVPATSGNEVYYPGERTMNTRKENTELGIPVDEEVWQKIKSM
ncbi:3-dehydro-L-gulonate 2-dehydrogenase [Bacillus sp. JJ1521]|uniref:3-dehydro-L-gulonate 2-dehydrogenase n=1 Tax=Bacillus sp. JJ1521 TaxID=3122957 RepID=UPI003000D2FA